MLVVALLSVGWAAILVVIPAPGDYKHGEQWEYSQSDERRNASETSEARR